MANLKKVDCPFCQGTITFKHFKQYSYVFECNKCPTAAHGFTSEEHLDSQYEVFKNIKKKKRNTNKLF